MIHRRICASARRLALVALGLILSAPCPAAQPLSEQDLLRLLEPHAGPDSVYTSISRIYIEPAMPSATEPAATEPAARERGSYLSLQCEVMRSPPVLSKVLESPDVRALSVFSKLPDPIGYLRKHVGAEVGKRDDILSVSVASPDPRESAVLVNVLVNTYISNRKESAEKGGSRLLARLQAEKDQMNVELKQTRERIAALRDSDPNLKLQPPNGENGAVQRMIQAAAALNNVNLQISANEGTYGPSSRQMTELRRLAAIYDEQYREAKADALKSVDKQQQIDALRVHETQVSADFEPLRRRISELQISEDTRRQISPVVILEVGETPSKPSMSKESESAVIEQLKSDGINFTVDEAALHRLREAGASNAVLDAVKQVGARAASTTK